MPATFNPFPAAGGSSFFLVDTGGNSAGVSCHWQASNPSYISVSPSSGGGGSTFQFSVNFSVTANPDIGPRTSIITITQTEDNSKANVTITQPTASTSYDFSLSVTPGSQTVIAGTNTSYAIAINRIAGFPGSVCLSASGLPVNTSAVFSPACTTGNSSTLTVSTTSSTPVGTFPFSITGVNGTATRTTSATLAVNVAVAKGITTAVNPIANTMEVEYIGTDAHVHQLSYNGIWSKSDLSAITGAPGASTTSPGIKAIYNTLANSMEVHYIGADQHMYTLWYTGAWHFTDLTTTTGAPLAALNSSITAAMDPVGNTEDVEYIGTDHHVHQLWYNGLWHTTDLTVASGAAANADSSAGIHTLMNTIGNAMEVHYIGTDLHIYSLWYNGTWHEVDHTLNDGAPLAVAGSPLTASMDSIGNSEDLEYIGPDQHMHQLWYNGFWHPNDLMTASGADPNADKTSGIHTLLNSIGNAMEVHYIGTNHHIYSLWYNGTWHEVDHTLNDGAPLAIAGSPLTSAADTVASTIDLEYVGADQHVYQLWYNGLWHVTDLTTTAQ
jgi:hypothetical protein